MGGGGGGSRERPGRGWSCGAEERLWRAGRLSAGRLGEVETWLSGSREARRGTVEARGDTGRREGHWGRADGESATADCHSHGAPRGTAPFMERGRQLDWSTEETRPQKKRGRPSEEDLPRGSDRDHAGVEASGDGRFEGTD